MKQRSGGVWAFSAVSPDGFPLWRNGLGARVKAPADSFMGVPEIFLLSDDVCFPRPSGRCTTLRRLVWNQSSHEYRPGKLGRLPSKTGSGQPVLAGTDPAEWKPDADVMTTVVVHQ